jgi:hypothetical protein
VLRLILTRQRRLGASFDEAWAQALAAIPEFERPDDRALNHTELDRNDTLAALGRTRDEWERAYQRQPPPPPAPVPDFIPRLPRRRRATAV